jgi:hypothetical protein
MRPNNNLAITGPIVPTQYMIYFFFDEDRV